MRTQVRMVGTEQVSPKPVPAWRLRKVSASQPLTMTSPSGRTSLAYSLDEAETKVRLGWTVK